MAQKLKVPLYSSATKSQSPFGPYETSSDDFGNSYDRASGERGWSRGAQEWSSSDEGSKRGWFADSDEQGWFRGSHQWGFSDDQRPGWGWFDKAPEWSWMKQDAGALATGPSSSRSPYLVPLDERVSFTSILTTGDTVNDADRPGPDRSFRMAGTPDGIGAYDNNDGTFTILMDHEFQARSGALRDHGATGSFVSKLVVDKDTLKVVSGDDLVEQVLVYDPATGDYRPGVGGERQFDRLCSGDLADQSAFLFEGPRGDLGYEGRILLNGEESSSAGKGRAFAHVATGTEAGNSYELAWMGNQGWENVLANPSTGKKTVVIGLDDSSDGELYVYVGDKQATGNAVERAGLSGGSLYGIRVNGVANESRTDGIDIGPKAADGHVDRAKASFDLVALGPNGDVSRLDASQLDADAETKGVTDFLRPEDGAWDPTNPNVFYFVTTDAFNTQDAYGTPGSSGQSRLYKLTFKDASHPTRGGSIEMLLDGTEATQMMDNITVNSRGQVLIQEDPGNEQYSAKVWLYDPKTDTRHAGSSTGNSGLTVLAEHDPQRFGSRDHTSAQPATPPYNTNEESSGIVDVSGILGRPGKDVYLLDVQAHYPAAADPYLAPYATEVVEGGQLLAMTVDAPRHEWDFYA